MAAATDTPADAVQAPPPATKPLDRLREGLNRLTNQQKIILMVAIAAVVYLRLSGRTRLPLFARGTGSLLGNWKGILALGMEGPDPIQDGQLHRCEPQQT